MFSMSGIQSVSVTASQSFASVGTQGQQSLQPFGNLDLTEAQRTQIRSIFTSAKQDGTSQSDVQNQVNAVLTPAQQKTLAGDKAAGSGHHHHHHHESEATSQTSAAPNGSAPAASSTSSTSTILSAITNIQNQAAAAQSTLVENLQQQVLAANGDTNNS
jgi:hypothetical protein